MKERRAREADGSVVTGWNKVQWLPYCVQGKHLVYSGCSYFPSGFLFIGHMQ